ncbi:MAG: hypothetical protein AB7O43_07475 [Hyphomicrobiaceae bacterium]
MMYYSEIGSDGVRVSTRQLNLPMAVKFRSPRTHRLEVQLADGTRWIEEKDVVFGGTSQAQ